MRIAAYLSRSRHGVFYFRWPVPARLHPSRKRSHVRLSLRTRCPAAAERLSRLLALAGQSWIETASAHAMRYDEIRGQVARHFQEQLARFKAGVMENGPPDDDRQMRMRNIRAMLGRDWATHADNIGADQAAQQVHAFCEHRGIDPDSLAPNVRQGLNEALVHGVSAFWRDAAAFLDGLNEFHLDPAPAMVPAVSDPVPTAGVATARPAGRAYASGQSPLGYQDVLTEYLTELDRLNGLAPKTASQKREVLALLGEITGQKPVAELTKVDAREVKDTLLRYPKNRQKQAATRGKPLKEVLDMLGVERISPSTAKTYLSHMREFITWAKDHGHAHENIFDGIAVKVRKSKAEKRDAFTKDQLGHVDK